MIDVETCLLAGMDATTRSLAEQVARRIFPEISVVAVTDLEEALKFQASPGTELLVLADPGGDGLARAMAATDAAGLPRWALVVLGDSTMGGAVEVVSRGEWSEAILARAFRSAVIQHQLRRENARLLGDLRTVAYRINHDLRTPIGGIICAGEMVKEVLAEKDPSTSSLTDPILSSADDLMKLIERVGFVLKAAINPVAKRPVAMKDAVSAALQRLELRMAKVGVTVSQPEDWPEVQGVASWLETVWWNFLANALRHAGNQTSIRIGWNRDDGEHRFWICDGGPGLPAEKRRQLFQPFHLMHRADSAAGVGLSIVQRLVELQGGHCGYGALADGQSSFFFTLPLTDIAMEKARNHLTHASQSV